MRKEIHDIIDVIPDASLSVLKPLLTHLADEYWKPVIEPVDDGESAVINEAVQRYENAPSSFTDWEDAKREMGF